jgi:hypothetical protein
MSSMIPKDAPMRFSQNFRMKMTRRGEKEARLSAFIVREIGSLAADARQSGPSGPVEERGMLVIARSAQSPVVKTVAALAREIAAAGCAVRVILARADRAAVGDALVAMSSVALDCEVRRVRNPCLIEAHEQLVLGRRACWTGDSMRRDPAICDAYESFVEDCAEAAAAARATFERLWGDGEPLSVPEPIMAGAATPKAIGPAASMVRRP